MTCPKCDGEGTLHLVARKLFGPADWAYED